VWRADRATRFPPPQLPGGGCSDDPDTWVQLARSDDWCERRWRSAAVLTTRLVTRRLLRIRACMRAMTRPPRPFCRWAAHPHGWADARCPAALYAEPAAEASAAAGAVPGTSTALPLTAGPLLRALRALRAETDRRGCAFVAFTTIQARARYL
jgi:hypothetical protein